MAFNSFSKRNRPQQKRLFPQRSQSNPQQEFKSVDLDDNTLELNSTGAYTLLNGVSRGTDLSNRIGRNISMRSLEIHGWMSTTDSGGVSQVARIMIVLDKQCNGSAMALTDILKGVTVVSLKNLVNKKRFKILYDKTHALAEHSGNNAGHIKPFEFYKKFNHPVEFNAGDAGTIGDITSGALYIIGLSNIASGSTDANLFYSSRIRYTDN